MIIFDWIGLGVRIILDWIGLEFRNILDCKGKGLYRTRILNWIRLNKLDRIRI